MAEGAEGPQLSQRELDQALKPQRTANPEALMALSRQITTEPALRELCRQLVVNPYISEAQDIMAEKFPNSEPADRARAVVLAEPEGDYDRDFRTLSHEKKKKALFHQIDSSADVAIRLEKYFTEHAQEFWELSHKDIYARLSKEAFETDDPQKIEELYAQNQRRGFRLAIVNFIEDLARIKDKDYKNRFEKNPRATAETVLGQQFEGIVRVKVSPLGFTIYLDEKDYIKAIGVNNFTDRLPAGHMMRKEELPTELRGKTVLINNGGEIRGVPTGEALAETEAHEMKHVLYENYFEDAFSETQTNVVTMLFSRAKDEIIAYVANNIFHVPLSNQHIDIWQDFLNMKEDWLWSIKDVSPEARASRYHSYRQMLVQAAGQVRTFQWVQRQLYAAVARGENGLTVEKAEALLRLTPVEKVSRLGNYFGVDPEDVKAKEKEESQSLEQGFSDRVNALVLAQQEADNDLKAETERWMAQFDDIKEFSDSYPNEAIPGLLDVITNSNNRTIVGMSMLLIKDIFTINGHTMPMDTLYDIRIALESTIKSREGFGIDKLANILIQFIDKEQVDFVHNKPPNLDQQ